MENIIFILLFIACIAGVSSTIALFIGLKFTSKTGCVSEQKAIEGNVKSLKWISATILACNIGALVLYAIMMG